MNAQTFPSQRAGQLPVVAAQIPWLIQDLWTDQAVGILGGEPKCCKSFLALDLALAVASGAPCLRRYPVRHSGPVLFFPAEDSLAIVRHRLDGIAAAYALALADLPLHVITAPSMRLDLAADRQRLAHTIQALQPVLLVLDPLIRLHQLDENDASQIASLLGFLRQLQRQFHLAVLLVHHAKKDGAALRPGQALRGSSELHGWGDSNLYLRRQREQLFLSVEHRAAPSLDPIPVQLTQHGAALALAVLERSVSVPSAELTPVERVRQTLGRLQAPVPVQQLRKLCGIRTAAVCAALEELFQRGEVRRTSKGYQLPFPVSLPTDPEGNGNGKPTPGSGAGSAEGT